MLVLDSTIGCIEADESQVLVLYRSAPIVLSPAPGMRPASMEAYVCTIQAKSQTKVHLALVADNRRIYVYLESLKAADAAGIERSLQQALSSAKSMGFVPDPVDLNYRPAMREVVLRNIKILRSPGSKGPVSLRAGLPGAPILPVPSPADAQAMKASDAPVKDASPASAAADPPPPPLPPARGASAPVPPAAAGSPPLSRGERSSVGLLQLEKELQLMGAERDALLAQLQQLSVAHQEVVMELTEQREEATRVAAEMDRLAHAEEELKRAVAEREPLEGKVRDLTEKLQESQRLAEERQEQNSRLAAELAAARKKGKALLSECEALQKKAAAATQTEKVSEENRALRAELDELESVRDAELGRMTSLEQDLFTLAAELGTATAEAATARGELAAAVAGVATAEAELVVTRSKVLAAEAKVAAMSRKLQATELELGKARGELAALGEQPSSAGSATANPATAGTTPTVAPVTVPASGGEPSTHTTKQPVVSGQPAVTDAPRNTATPERTAPLGKTAVPEKTAAQDKSAAPEQAATTEQAGAAEKAAASEKAAATGKAATAKKAAVPEHPPLKESVVIKPTPAQASTPPEAARSLVDELDAAFAGLQQAPLAPCGEENAAGSLSAELADLPPVEEIISEASNWYGDDAFLAAPALAGPDGAGAEGERAQVEGVKPPQAHDFPPFGELQDGFFSLSEDPAPAGQFILRPDIKVIEYVNPQDVVELHQSINNANMSPDGKGQESCRGYICSLKCGDKLQVFAAIYGTRSGRTSVYAPERQPEDEAGYAGVMRSAINFAEEVGLMMEPVKGGAAALQVDSIVQCPVLKKAA